jgi:signal transduction histidine kinase
MTASAVFDENGDLAGVRGIFRDITEREKVVESQRLANLGKLAADVAHEVNNPITIILARAEMLKAKRKDDEDIQEKMQIIISQCEDAISIVKRLLKFSKPSKKQFTRININDRIKTVIDLIGHQFLSCQVSINTYFAGNLPEVEADEKQIQEVFMNLLRNAKEAIGADGKVEIYTYEKKGRVYADIKDSGEGISSETMNKIFDPFFTTKENGTGLGVSVCYGIMRAHNGDLQYFSKKDEGTTARVILPAAE